MGLTRLTERALRVEAHDRCPDCRGDGHLSQVHHRQECSRCSGTGVPFHVLNALDCDAGLTNAPAKPHSFPDGTLVENIETGVRLFVWGADHHDAAGAPVYSLATRSDDSWVVLEAGVPEEKLFDVHAELLADRPGLEGLEEKLGEIQFGGLASSHRGVTTIVMDDAVYPQLIDAARRGLNLATENRRLRQWVSDMQEGCWVNCVYCGHRYGHEKDTPVAIADVLKAHVEQCPDHPMSELKRRLTKLETALRAAAASRPSECERILVEALEGTNDTKG